MRGTRATGARATRGGGLPHVAACGFCRAPAASASAAASSAAAAARPTAAAAEAEAARAAAAAAPGRRSRPSRRSGPAVGVVTAASAAVGGGSRGDGGGGSGSRRQQQQQRQQQSQQQQQNQQPDAASQGGGGGGHSDAQIPAPLPPLLAREMPLLRRLATAPSAHAAADLLHDWVWQRQQQEQQERQQAQQQQERQQDKPQQEQRQQQQQEQERQPPPPLLPLTEADAELLLAAALERGNAALALGLYDEMALVAGGGLGGAAASSSSSSTAFASYPGGGGGGASGGVNGGGSSRDGRTFPPLTLRLTTALVLGLCRAMRLPEAMRVLARVRSRGGPVASPAAGNGALGPAASQSADDDGFGGGAGTDDAAAAASDAAAPLSVASFGLVVRSPLAPHGPLTVVPPHEGAQAAADSASRYEFELFSGRVASIKSEALPQAGGLGALLGAALRSAGGVVSPGGGRRAPPAAAVHELVVRAPDGSARAFRVAAASADVPARVGERVTLACAPARGAPSRAPRRRLLLTPSPPGSRPGEPLEVTNHATGAVLPLLPAPTKDAAAGGAGSAIGGWALPLAVALLAGGDAASALVDPALPALLAAGAAAASLSALAGSAVVVPALKRLPAASVEVEYARQRLLSQHQGLASKAGAALREARDDARALARLWQLQAKMEAVGGDMVVSAGVSFGASSASSSSFPAAAFDVIGGGGGGGGAAVVAASASAGAGAAAAALAPSSPPAAYGARIGRVAMARAEIESRLARRVELLDGYARVMAMIEIEIELDFRDTAELLQLQLQSPGGGGFGDGGATAAAGSWGGGVGAAEMARLAELEALREEWAGQAEARDEVERLLG